MKLISLRDLTTPPNIPGRITTVACLSGAWEIVEKEMHVGLVPALVNNQMGLVFAFEGICRRMASCVANWPMA